MTNLPWGLVMPWVEPRYLIGLSHAYRSANYAQALQNLSSLEQQRLARALVRADAAWCLDALVRYMAVQWRAPVLRLFKGVRYPDYIELLRAYSLQCGSMRSRALLSGPSLAARSNKQPKHRGRSEGRWRR